MVGRIREVGLVACLMTALVLTACAAPVSACERSEGDFWTYEIITYLEEIEMTGSITYAYDQDDTLEVDNVSHEVSVMSVTGSISGSGDLIGVPVNVTGTYSGTVYEDMSALATVKEDMRLLANISRDTGQYIQTDVWVIHDVTTYSPPQGMDFVPGDVEPGDVWSEVVDRTTNSTIEINGDLDHQSEEVDENITFTYTVATAKESVVTDAGTFECLKINLTSDESEDYDLYWYSEEVGYFVKISMFSEDGGEPYTYIELTSFLKAEEDSTMDIMVIGIGVLIAVVIIVAVALAMRKKGKKPQIAPQAPPPVQ